MLKPRDCLKNTFRIFDYLNRIYLLLYNFDKGNFDLWHYNLNMKHLLLTLKYLMVTYLYRQRHVLYRTSFCAIFLNFWNIRFRYSMKSWGHVYILIDTDSLQMRYDCVLYNPLYSLEYTGYIIYLLYIMIIHWRKLYYQCFIEGQNLITLHSSTQYEYL